MRSGRHFPSVMHKRVAVGIGPLRRAGTGDALAPLQTEVLVPGTPVSLHGISRPARGSSDGRDVWPGVPIALLVTRARGALWTVIASNAFFAVTDLRLSRAALVQ